MMNLQEAVAFLSGNGLQVDHSLAGESPAWLSASRGWQWALEEPDPDDGPPPRCSIKQVPGSDTWRYISERNQDFGPGSYDTRWTAPDLGAAVAAVYNRFFDGGAVQQGWAVPTHLRPDWQGPAFLQGLAAARRVTQADWRAMKKEFRESLPMAGPDRLQRSFNLLPIYHRELPLLLHVRVDFSDLYYYQYDRELSLHAGFCRCAPFPFLARLAGELLEPLTAVARDHTDARRYIARQQLAELGTDPGRRAAIRESLVAALDDPDPNGRYAAVRGLGRLAELGERTPAVVLPLLALLRRSTEPERNQKEILDALAKVGPAAVEAVNDLSRVLRDGNWWVGEHAAAALGRIGRDAAAALPYVHYLRARSPQALPTKFPAVLNALGEWPVPFLTGELISGDPLRQSTALDGALAMGAAAREALPAVQALVGAADSSLAHRARYFLDHYA